MSRMKSHHEIALSSIQCFSNDGTLDLGELNFLLGLALRDDIIDEDEKRVLRNIFSRVLQDEVQPVVWERIQEARKRYGL